MKKFLIIIMIFLMLGTLLPSTSAQQVGSTETLQQDEPILQATDGGALGTLTGQRQEAITARDGLQRTREGQQGDLSRKREERDRLPPNDPRRATLDGEIRTLEEDMKKTDRDIQSANQTISGFDQQIENNASYKISQINKKYESLQKSTKSSSERIIGNQTNCSVEAGTSVNKQDFCQEYFNLQLDANEQYSTFLEAQRKLEICRANPPCRDQPLELKKFEDAAKAASALVAATLSKITQMEIQKNQQATFDVSDIFSLSENTPGDDVEPTDFLDVTNTIADWLITLVSSLAVTALIIGGFIMIISGGDENRLEMGKTIFVYALIGLIITLMSYGIITFIQSLFYPEASNIPPGQPSSVETPASPTPAPVQEGVDFIPPPDPSLGLPT